MEPEKDEKAEHSQSRFRNHENFRGNGQNRRRRNENGSSSSPSANKIPDLHKLDPHFTGSGYPWWGPGQAGTLGRTLR